MKTLLVMRHAKSDWSESSGPALDDHSRPLNKRGRRQASVMTAFLRHCGLVPQRIISSTAVRAASTAAIVAAECGLEVEEHGQLYLCDTATVLSYVSGLGDTCEVAMVVGHNPTMAELVGNLITELAAFVRFPTAAIACLGFEIDSWTDITAATGILHWLVNPGIIEDLMTIKKDER